MKTTILGFGIVKEYFNGPSIEIGLQDGFTVAGLRQQLESLYPEMKKLHAYMVAVNDKYAEDELLIHSEDEIAIIPPVSGG